jgi:uncharacterized membrane protein
MYKNLGVFINSLIYKYIDKIKYDICHKLRLIAVLILAKD